MSGSAGTPEPTEQPNCFRCGQALRLLKGVRYCDNPDCPARDYVQNLGTIAPSASPPQAPTGFSREHADMNTTIADLRAQLASAVASDAPESFLRRLLAQARTDMESLRTRLDASEQCARYETDAANELRASLAHERSRADRDETETEMLRGIVWTLADTLARRHLVAANAQREEPNNWPAGQSWDELVGSSHSIFRARAYEEAGLDRATVIRLLCDDGGNAKPYATGVAAKASE